jgi:predicted metal-dependent hydrolase
MLFRRPKTPALQSGDVVDVAGCRVRLRVHARSARISLKIDARERLVVATAPTLRRLGDAVVFAESRADWMAAQLARLPEPERFLPGKIIRVDGRIVRLERAAMRITARLKPGAGEEPARLIASGEGEAFGRAVVRLLKKIATERLTERTAHYAARLDQPMPTVAIADARGRWGSCRKAHGTQPAAIRFNWRLILAPPEVLDYVAAHECAHLIEANHGPDFWALNQDLHPGVKQAKAWLKANGARLHSAG